MHKINILKTNKTELAAILLVIQKNYVSLYNKGKQSTLDFALASVKKHFIYSPEKEEKIQLNLVLFLLGYSDNEFDKALNLQS